MLCVFVFQSLVFPFGCWQVRTRSKREKVQKAYDYLMTKEAESGYRGLVKKHNKFLRSQPDASNQDRRRPLQFIETPGIECGLWPTLYFCYDMCETVERASDARRLRRQRVVPDENSEEEEFEERHSVKRSFMRKVLSPIIGYTVKTLNCCSLFTTSPCGPGLGVARMPVLACRCAWS